MQLHLEHRIIDEELLRKTRTLIDCSVFPSDSKNLIHYALDSLEAFHIFMKEQRIKTDKMRRLAGLTTSENPGKVLDGFEEVELDDDCEVIEPSPLEADDSRQSDSNSQNQANSPDHQPMPKKRKKPCVSIMIPNRKESASVCDHSPGSSCPNCPSGKMHPDTPRTAKILMAARLIELVVVEREALRCRTCETTVVAPAPEILSNSACGVHASLIAMIADLRFRLGFPSLRMENWLADQNVILSDSRQAQVFAWAADELSPFFSALCQQIANSKLVYRDDTPGRIIDYQKEQRLLKASGEKAARVGVYTTYVEAKLQNGSTLVLAETSQKHCGEVFAELLTYRTEGDSILSMSDASPMNFVELPEGKSTNALCHAHARRKFFDLLGSYPETSKSFLQIFDDLFRNDAEIASVTDDPYERLKLHQQLSSPLMVKLSMLIAAKSPSVPKNSYLSDALHYVDRHWDGLTHFLRTPGVPISNNLAERGIKAPIRHRRNSLFFKTENGAFVGTVITSILLTAHKNDLSPADYLSHLLTHRTELWNNPEDFMPWCMDGIISRRRKAS